MSELEGLFPFPEMRPSQRLALEKFISTTERDRKFTILELPTGIGKSGVAVTLGRWASLPGHNRPGGLGGAYLLTIQKMLQQQYLTEFPELVEMKGAANYRCAQYPVSCEEGSKLARALTKKPCECSCPYKEAKETFLSTPFGVTNFAYFLTLTAFQKGLIRPRKVLIIDEAHNTETSLINHSNIEVSRTRANDLKITFPSPPLGPRELKRAKKWIEAEVKPAVSVKRAAINLELDRARSKGDDKALGYILRDEAALDQFEYKLDLFVKSDSDLWFVGHSDKIEIKPLTGELFADELLFGMADHVVFLSATILDPRTFVRSLGLSPKQCGYLGVPSEFPVENRRIVFSPAGSMSYKNYEATLPKMLRKIEKVFAKHPDEKGIIHCQSFKTMNHIVDHFRNTPHARRLLSHTSRQETKAAALARHTTTDEPTVLLSPSMTEGLDLRGDLSRFQVVAKMPFASLADPYVKTRMGLDPDWYRWQTALTLVQALGRSVRSKDDHAISYIIDGDFGQFMTQAQSILPEWWLDSVEVK